MMQSLSFKNVHSSWQPLLTTALARVDTNYLTHLTEQPHWLPGTEAIFNAFSLPRAQTHFILLGESPYPRAASANGYAFWDGAVTSLWSPTGLSKTVNRATSLRNFIKMLLISEGLLTENDTSQATIAALNKANLVTTGAELFGNLLQKGFLLLNASLVLSENAVHHDAKAWKPFLGSLLETLAEEATRPTLLLFGNIAKTLENIPCSSLFERLVSEHPYNVSFITNPKILSFFKSLHLLRKI